MSRDRLGIQGASPNRRKTESIWHRFLARFAAGMDSRPDFRIALAVLLSAASVFGQEGGGTVTLMVGSPRFAGEAMSLTFLEPVLAGRVLETGSADAVGYVSEDVVVHQGQNTRATSNLEPGRKRIVLQEGYVVVYLDPGSKTEVRIETPFGWLTARPEWPGSNPQGWFTARHDLAQPGISPAVSTFGTVDGTAEVGGTVPAVPAMPLPAGQIWRIAEGQIPGPPQPGDVRGPAEELRDVLHRGTVELLRGDVELALANPGRITGAISFTDLVSPDQQNLVGPNDVAVGITPVGPPILLPPVEGALVEPVIRDAQAYPAGDVFTARAQFVSYPGDPFDPNWNEVLTDVDGQPAFQPIYLERLDNGGFSYIQFAGPAVELASDSRGEVFLVGPREATSGWAVFTPETAVAADGFDVNSSLVEAVTEGFQAIARAEYLAGGGTIAGTGPGDPDGFVQLEGQQVSLNAAPPVGYPRLDRLNEVAELPDGQELDPQPFSDQLAAVGAGRNPQNLAEPDSRLLFVSGSTQDAFGNTLNFDGQPIGPTDLQLPGDRGEPARELRPGFAASGIPLRDAGDNTVGIQFVGSGTTIAVIHHTGLRDAGSGTSVLTDHFEIERGPRHSIIRWRSGGRVEGADGQPVQLEDLTSTNINGAAQPLRGQLLSLRNELFVELCREVNRLVPVRTPTAHTACGPSQIQPEDPVVRPVPRVVTRAEGPQKAVQARRPNTGEGFTATGLSPAGARGSGPSIPSSNVSVGSGKATKLRPPRSDLLRIPRVASPTGASGRSPKGRS
jgi:hypothetical protein